MANYLATARTNYFRVTDEEKYKKLFSNLLAEDDIHDFSGEVDGEMWHGFGSFSSISYDKNDGSYTDIHDFFEDIQEIIPEGEAFIYIEVGYEKLRYITGFYGIVTKNDIVFGELMRDVIDKAREMLGDPEWQTQLEF